MDLTDQSSPKLIEIKSRQTARLTFVRHLSTVGTMLDVPAEHRFVIYRGDERFAAQWAIFEPASQYLRFIRDAE